MNDLITALQIFLKYGNSYSPTHCEHDVMYITEINPKDVSEEDILTLDKLGFFIDDINGGFKSYRYGSA